MKTFVYLIENKEDILADYLKLYCYYINKEQKLVVMYLELIFTGIKAESWKVAEVRLSSQAERKIVYPGIETSQSGKLLQTTYHRRSTYRYAEARIE